jgi:Cu/Ag efflux pump CusA
MKPRPNQVPLRFLLLAGSLAVLTVAGLAIAGFFFLEDRPLPVRDPIRIEVIAQFPGSSAPEVEQQVAIPLEISLAGMEGLKVLRSKSVPGIACLQAEFNDGVSYQRARQTIINCLSLLMKLPEGVNPQLSPAGSSQVIVRYTLHSPPNSRGGDIYTLNDLRTLQDWFLEREFRRVPRVLGVTSFGGSVRRYEIHPDPERLRRYGVSLTQLEKVVASSNGNIGGILGQGKNTQVVRALGALGGGRDPMEKAFSMKSPKEAAAYLRGEEQERLREIRKLVITTTNNVPIRIDDVVEGGPLPQEAASTQGVVVAHQARLGHVGISRPRMDAGGRVVRDEHGTIVWDDCDDCVQGVVYLRYGEDAQTALRDLRDKIKRLNTPGTMLPGVRLEPYLQGTDQPDHFWARAHYPVNISEEQAAALVRRAREVVRGFPEVDRVVSEVGGSEDGSILGGNYVGRLCVTLRPAGESPKVADDNRPRTKAELMDAIAADLQRKVADVGWDCLSHYREDLAGEFAASTGEVVLKIHGPDLDELEKLAGQAKSRLEKVAGVRRVRPLQIRGLPHHTWRIDKDKCARLGVTTGDVNYVLRCALEGKNITQMIEGEKAFDIALRWPAPRRRDKEAILDLPLDVVNQQAFPLPGAAAPRGDPMGAMPRLRLGDVVSPMDANGAPDDKSAGVAAIYREEGQRVLLLRVGIRGRAQAAVCTEGEQSIAPLLKRGYRLGWDN